MQKSFVAAPLFSFSSVSPGPDVLAVAAAVAEDSGSWGFCPGKELHIGPGLSPSFLPVGIYLCQQMCRWSVLVLGSEEHAPTNPPNEPSVFNDLSSGGWAVSCFFFFFLSVDRKFFSIVPGGFMLQILSAGFSFYWPFFWPPCTGYREGGKSHSRDLWLDCCPCVFTFFYYFCYSGSVLSLSCQMFETRLLGLLNPELTLTF